MVDPQLEQRSLQVRNRLGVSDRQPLYLLVQLADSAVSKQPVDLVDHVILCITDVKDLVEPLLDLA
jgi:hypothetical protein